VKRRSEALSALLRRRGWELDKCRVEHARALSTLQCLERSLGRLHERRVAAAEAVQAGQTLDPLRCRAQLGFLSRLADEITVAQAERDAERLRCEALRGACAVAQLRLEAVERQRARVLAAHASERARTDAARADDDAAARWTRVPADPERAA
jgi:hypothetical protein